jgi:16S rRNA (guanine527-N7)-methyltransferase
VSQLLTAPSALEIEAFVANAGFTVPAAAPAQIATWLSELCVWNRKLDLTAARSKEALTELMLRDAVELAKVIPHGARTVDVGAGAGGPGLALALMRPDLSVTLIDSLAKRTSFLRTVVSGLALKDVHVVLENIDATLRRGEKWKIAVSRATFEPERWLEVAALLLQTGGHCAVLLSRLELPAHASMKLETRVDYSDSGKARSLAWFSFS